MKRIVTLLCALSIACALSAPAFAKKGSKGKKDEAASSSTTKGKAHKQHAKKKGATEGKKEGQTKS